MTKKKLPSIKGYNKDGSVYRAIVYTNSQIWDRFNLYVKELLENSNITDYDKLFLSKLKTLKDKKNIYSNLTIRDYFYKFNNWDMTQDYNYNTIIKIK
jgi:hypothetical protein